MNDPQHILVIGSGGREHALVHALARSPGVRISCAPGNPGIQSIATCVAIAPNDINELVKYAEQNKVDLTVVGPELPLTLGIVDAFEARGLAIFGPSRLASELEASKCFTKEFCKRFHIPTAGFAIVESVAEGTHELDRMNLYPVVIKADGLAQGKGVVIAKTRTEAIDALSDMLVSQRFGDAGRRVVIEQFVTGQEVSLIFIVDGTECVMLPAAQDHKRVFDGNLGPNTGGMGAYAPANWLSDDLRERVMTTIIQPTLAGMIQMGRRYRGFLYAGLMIDDTGTPWLLEYNCRLGDPETQVMLPLLMTPLTTLIMAALTGQLGTTHIECAQASACTVVLASEGYPTESRPAQVISGLDTSFEEGVTVYHAGSKKIDDVWYTSGGRVLCVTAIDKTLALARAKAYRSVEQIRFAGMHYRHDIASLTNSL